MRVMCLLISLLFLTVHDVSVMDYWQLMNFRSSQLCWASLRWLSGWRIAEFCVSRHLVPRCSPVFTSDWASYCSSLVPFFFQDKLWACSCKLLHRIYSLKLTNLFMIGLLCEVIKMAGRHDVLYWTRVNHSWSTYHLRLWAEEVRFSNDVFTHE